MQKMVLIGSRGQLRDISYAGRAKLATSPTKANYS